ncbi:MAG: hypothetical protein GY930_09785 [bacterium]|nr:hypothetical protein [bacterium]
MPIGFIALFFAWITKVVLVASLRGFGRGAWIMRVRSKGLVLKLRAYRNDDLPRGDRVVLFIPWTEIESAWSVSGTRETPSSDRDCVRTERFRHIDLQLTHDRTEDVEQALRAERNSPRTKRVHFNKTTVTLPERDRLRIHLSSNKQLVKPGVKRILGWFGEHVKIEDPLRIDETVWLDLAPTKLEDRALSMIEQGDKIGAVVLLRQRYGWGLTRTMAFVDELFVDDEGHRAA